MSQTTDNSLQAFADASIPLMKEYGKKLDDLRDQMITRRDQLSSRNASPQLKAEIQVELNRLNKLVDRLAPPAKRLAQHVSQIIEHGKVDDFTRLELSLRLAEFEHALLTVKDV